MWLILYQLWFWKSDLPCARPVTSHTAKSHDPDTASTHSRRKFTPYMNKLKLISQNSPDDPDLHVDKSEYPALQVA